jgi:hypothetical protein
MQIDKIRERVSVITKSPDCKNNVKFQILFLPLISFLKMLFN